jgi:translocation and assembly module TamA
MTHKLSTIILLLASLSVVATSNAKESVELTEKELVAAAILANEEAGKKEELAKKPADKPNSKAGESVKETLASIEVSGVDSELKKNIELHMPVSIPACNADRGEVRQFFTTVKKNLRKASRALGYYDSEFRSGGSIVKGCWKLRLKITQGQPTKITSQNIKVIGEGKNDELFRAILKELPYKKGDIFNHQKYTDFKTQLSEATQALGYFDAEFKQHSVAVNPLAHQAMINLVLDTGKRYRYGKVTVDQEVLSDTAIQNFLILKTGKLYKTGDLIKQQQLLQGSGYYKLIKVEVLRDQALNYQVPVHITLTRKKRNAIKYKVGYGSDTGARVSAELNRRWTGSKGKQLKAKIQAAQNLSGLTLQLTSPRKNPEDDILVYNFEWKQDKNDDVTSQSINLGGKYTSKKSNDWIQSATIELLLDKTQVDGEAENKSNLLLFGVGLDKTKADNLLYPNDGWRLRFGLKGAAKGVISDQNVLQFTASAKQIKTLGKGRFIGRVKLGTSKVDDFDSLPKSLRFFAGGGASVRGYGFEALGDTNQDDQVIGGKHLLELSLEYQHPITDEWSAAAFIDAGNAFSDFKDSKLKVGVGFGARWRSPIGPVRIDVGFPKDDFKDPHLYLSVGSDL